MIFSSTVGTQAWHLKLELGARWLKNTLARLTFQIETVFAAVHPRSSSVVLLQFECSDKIYRRIMYYVGFPVSVVDQK